MPSARRAPGPGNLAGVEGRELLPSLPLPAREGGKRRRRVTAAASPSCGRAERRRPEASGPALRGGERRSGCRGLGGRRSGQIGALRRGGARPARGQPRPRGPLACRAGAAAAAGGGGKEVDGGRDSGAGAGRAPAGRPAAGQELEVTNLLSGKAFHRTGWYLQAE